MIVRGVSQDFDNAALADMTIGAVVGHSFQFVLQSSKPTDALTDFDEPRLGDRVGGGTRLVRVILEG